MNRQAKESTVKTWVSTFVYIGMVGTVNLVHGQVVIDTNTVIDVDNSFPASGIEVIDGGNSPTVVQVVEGGQVGLPSFVRGSSVLAVSGGSMSQVRTFDSSSIDIAGGELFSVDRDTIEARGHSTVNTFQAVVLA